MMNCKSQMQFISLYEGEEWICVDHYTEKCIGYLPYGDDTKDYCGKTIEFRRDDDDDDTEHAKIKALIERLKIDKLPEGATEIGRFTLVRQLCC